MKQRAQFFAAAVLAVGCVVFASDDVVSTNATVPYDAETMPARVTDIEGVNKNLLPDGRVFIGGQPSKDALARLKERGVTAVVCLRTAKEMDYRERVSFDEASVVTDLGIEHVFIPLGGDNHPYTPAAVDRFAEVLNHHKGPAFLHCTMGWRASCLWVAYLIREQGFSLDDAMAHGEAIAVSSPPLADLLDRKVKLALE